MAFGRKSLAGAGYVVLNVIRVMNITSLLAVIASTSILLVRAFNTQSFFFFDAMSNVIRIIITGFLILTELPLFKTYFIRNWPLFGQQSGFVMLGISMLLIGNSVLANLNKPAASQDNIGLAFWRLVISSGIIIIIMGTINILASYIFRDTTYPLTARQVRSNGATASHRKEVESSIIAASPKAANRRSRYKSFLFRSPNQASQRDSLPSYQTNTYMTQNHTATPPMPSLSNIEQYRNGYAGNPQTPHVRMPSVRDHQSSVNEHEKCTSPGAASSKYSMDENMTRPNLAHHPAMTAGYAR